ncbi:MAG: hypothetical protein V4773_28790 [Verrucomicrobiota bacterium]
MKRLLILVALVLALPVIAANRRVDRESRKIVMGPADAYNLGVFAGDEPADFFVNVFFSRKINLDGLTATLGDAGPLRVGERRAVKSFARSGEAILLYITRAQIEVGSFLGLHVMLQAGGLGRGVEFEIPSDECVALLQMAQPYDRYAAREESYRRAVAELEDLRREASARLAAKRGKQEEERRTREEEIRRAVIADKEAEHRQLEALVAEDRGLLAELGTATAEAASARGANIPSLFAPYRKKGTAKIIGQASLTTREVVTHLGASNNVWLIPAVPWALRAADLTYRYPFSKWSEPVRAMYISVTQITETDALGHFEFHDLPAGEYQLETNIYWKERDPRDGSEKSIGGRGTQRLTVKDGAEERVALTSSARL